VKVLHNYSGSFGRSGDGIFCCDGRMLLSAVAIVCHINGKASAGELSGLGSIVLRSSIAGSKLLICVSVAEILVIRYCDQQTGTAKRVVCVPRNRGAVRCKYLCVE